MEAGKEVKERLEKKISRFKILPAASQEANVLRTYIETLFELPWQKESKDDDNIHRAEKILNQDHYGLEKVKERILEYLAVRILNKKGSSPDPLSGWTARNWKNIHRPIRGKSIE